MSLIPLVFAVLLAAQPDPVGPGPTAAPQMMQAVRGPPPPEAVIGEEAGLPITFTSGVPTLDVEINGKGPFKIGFDTGAPGGPHLSTRLVQELGLQPVGEAMVGDPSGRKGLSVKLYRLDSVAFGGVSAKGWVGTGQPPRPGKSDNLDGVVGLGAFAGYVVTIDYPHSRFGLKRGALPPADGKTVFSYAGGAHPSAPLTVEGRTIPAHIDTGNTVSGVILPSAFVEGLRHKAEAKPSGVAHTVSNTIKMFSLPIDGDARVGRTPLTASLVVYPSLIPVANIGSPALMHVVVQVDTASHLISLRLPE
jgi:hypothetical protein